MQHPLKFRENARANFAISVVQVTVLAAAFLSATSQADHAVSEVWSDSDGLQMKYLTNHDDLLNSKGSELSLSSQDAPIKQASASNEANEANEEQQTDGEAPAAMPAGDDKPANPSQASKGDDDDDDGGQEEEGGEAPGKQLTTRKQHKERPSTAAPTYRSGRVSDEERLSEGLERPSRFQDGSNSNSEHQASDRSELSSVDSGDELDRSSEVRSSNGLRFQAAGRPLREPEEASADVGSDEEAEGQSGNPEGDSKEMTAGNEARANEHIEEPKAAGEPDFPASSGPGNGADHSTKLQNQESSVEPSDADSKKAQLPESYSPFRERVSQRPEEEEARANGGQRPIKSPDDERDNFISPGHYPGSMAHLTQAASETQRKQLALVVGADDKQAQESSQRQNPSKAKTESETSKDFTAQVVQVTPEPELAPESQQIMAPILLATTTTQAPAPAVVQTANSTSQSAVPNLRRLKLRKYR